MFDNILLNGSDQLRKWDYEWEIWLRVKIAIEFFKMC